MANIHFAPVTLPGLRRVRRGRSVCGIPKTKKSADLVHYFWDGANSFFIFFFSISFQFPLRGGGHGPRGPLPLASFLLARRRLFIPGGTKQLIARNKSVREMPKALSCSGRPILSLRGQKCSGPSGHTPGPLGACNPNEKQKPPPLDGTRS